MPSVSASQAATAFLHGLDPVCRRTVRFGFIAARARARFVCARAVAFFSDFNI